MSLPATVSRRYRPARFSAVLTAATLALAGCALGSAADAPGSRADGTFVVAVTTNEAQCQVDVDSVPSGRARFMLHNTGSRVTEMYIYATGDRVLGEVENVGPATSRDLTVDLPPGDYEVACTPGMGVVSIRSPLKVTGVAAARRAPAGQLAHAVASARNYVETETQGLVDTRADDASATQPFVRLHRLEQDLFAGGDIKSSGPTASAALAAAAGPCR